jgi:hypothetical protein
MSADRHEALTLPAEPVDLQLHDVARGELRVAAGQRDALGRTGEDDVARFEHEVPRQVVDDLRHREDHVAGGSCANPGLGGEPAPENSPSPASRHRVAYRFWLASACAPAARARGTAMARAIPGTLIPESSTRNPIIEVAKAPPRPARSAGCCSQALGLLSFRGSFRFRARYVPDRSVGLSPGFFFCFCERFSSRLTILPSVVAISLSRSCRAWR